MFISSSINDLRTIFSSIWHICVKKGVPPSQFCQVLDIWCVFQTNSMYFTLTGIEAKSDHPGNIPYVHHFDNDCEMLTGILSS
jgi:hypothetical protein